jgi:hypothetical protein
MSTSFIDQLFEPDQLFLAPAAMEMVEEAADHVVRLTRAAVPCAEMEALEAGLMGVGLIGHAVPVRTGRGADQRSFVGGGLWPNPRGPLRGAMRPERLNPLFVGAESLKGVGAGLSRPLEKLGLTRVRDFLYHLPDRFVSRRVLTELIEARWASRSSSS